MGGNALMRYLGGKARLAKHLVPLIQRELARPEIVGYVEPFIGGGNVFCNVQVRPGQYKQGSDLHAELMALWVHVRDGGDLPDTITEADYARAKAGDGPAWWRGFVGFGCSFGGKWMGGFARGGHGADAPTAVRVLRKQAKGLHGASLFMAHYQVATMNTDNAVIYCDPPYTASTGYRGGFDHALFWNVMRCLSRTNIVLVSEYAAPDDVPCIATFSKKMGLRTTSGGQELRTEKLFRLAPAHFPLDAAEGGC